MQVLGQWKHLTQLTLFVDVFVQGSWMRSLSLTKLQVLVVRGTNVAKSVLKQLSAIEYPHVHTLEWNLGGMFGLLDKVPKLCKLVLYAQDMSELAALAQAAHKHLVAIHLTVQGATAAWKAAVDSVHTAYPMAHMHVQFPQHRRLYRPIIN
jgi:hypothetical protein